MIENQDIICLAFPNWRGNYNKSTVQLMTQFARYNRVLYINYQHTYKDVLFSFLGKNQIEHSRILGFQDRLEKIKLKTGGEILLYTPPPVWPVNWIDQENTYRRILKLNALKIGRNIQKFLKKLDFKAPILINAFNPFYGLHLEGSFEEKLSIYYCYDEIGAADWCKKHGPSLESAFIKKVDGVICSSRNLYENKKRYNPNCFLVQNGVDYDLFKQGFHEPRSPENKPSRIVYLGSIDNRINYPMIRYCAEKSPDLEFTFIGRKQLEPYPGDPIPNIRFLGPRPYDQLPELLKEFDLGIIPFVKNDFTRSIYPLKVNEYLAAGLPVVSTDFADLSEFKGLISQAPTQKTFLGAIRKELESNSREKAEARAQKAHSNSWENRAHLFSGIIDRLLKHQLNPIAEL